MDEKKKKKKKKKKWKKERQTERKKERKKEGRKFFYKTKTKGKQIQNYIKVGFAYTLT